MIPTTQENLKTRLNSQFLSRRHQSPAAVNLGLSQNAIALSFIKEVCKKENPQAVGRIKMHLVLTVTMEHRDDRAAPKSHSFLQHNSLLNGCPY